MTAGTTSGVQWDPLTAIAEQVPELKSVLIGGPDVPAPVPLPTPAPAPAPAPAPTPAPTPAATMTAAAAVSAALTESDPAPTSDLGVPMDIMSKFAGGAVAPASPAAGAAEADPGVPDHVAAQGEKAVETWKSLKEERNLFKTERDSLKARVEQAEAKVAEASKLALSSQEKQELDALRQRATELEDKIGRYDLTATKGFKEKFDSKLDALYSKGIRMLMARQMSQEDAARTMQEVFSKPDQRDAALMDLPGSVQGALLSLATDMDVIRDDRDSAIQNWKEQQALMAEDGSRATDLRLAKDIVQDTAVAVDAASAEGNWLYQLSEKDPEWNDQVEKRKLMVQAILRSASRVDLAKWVAEGVTARVTRDLYATTYGKLREVTAELNSVVKRRPGLGGGSRAPLQASKTSGTTTPLSPDKFLDTEFGR